MVRAERIGGHNYRYGTIAALYIGDATCLLRIFTNSTDAPVPKPPADAILAESTASFQP